MGPENDGASAAVRENRFCISDSEMELFFKLVLSSQLYMLWISWLGKFCKMWTLRMNSYLCKQRKTPTKHVLWKMCAPRYALPVLPCQCVNMNIERHSVFASWFVLTVIFCTLQCHPPSAKWSLWSCLCDLMKLACTVESFLFQFVSFLWSLNVNCLCPLCAFLNHSSSM